MTKSVASGLTKAKESTKSEDKSSYVAVVSKSVKSNGKDSADTNTLNEIKGIVNDVINIISGDTS